MPFGDILIIGAACRLPAADSLDSFRDAMANGVDAIVDAPSARWESARYFHPAQHVPGKTYVFSRGQLANVFRFDPGLFGISPREAMQMDPQQLLMLEVASEAFEDAGLPRSRVAGRTIGVYVGASFTDHATYRFGDVSSVEPYFMKIGRAHV